MSDSITIRITGKEIIGRLNCLEKDMKRVKYAAYANFMIILALLTKLFFL